MTGNNGLFAQWLAEAMQEYDRTTPAKRKECMNYIKEKLSTRELLEQLAEEAAELSHAALKKIRVDNANHNYTPITANKATENLLEELGDVMTVAEALGAYVSVYQCDHKIMRWATRLGYMPQKKNSLGEWPKWNG